ncbi:MAG: hypothetical protein M3357_00660 [Actinomycetota bacterium]|jgi:hypothetical protein|nr:hypothetical protein [Actinomycetota bacterium]
MTTTMQVTPMAPGEFGVEVTEGTQTTGHRVRVPEGFLDDMLLADADQETIVRESIAFLLEREPSTAILSEFSLTDISRYFPEYPEELRRRMT